MYSVSDEGIGFVKASWQCANIRSKFYSADPVFSQIVDEISPGKQFSIYLAYFKYGDLKGDTNDNFIPLHTGEMIRLSSSELSSDVKADLGYGIPSSPMGMVLDKSFEYFVDIDIRKVTNNIVFTHPYLIASPGFVFPMGRFMNEKSQYPYTPNGILSVTAGARSSFVLPNIFSRAAHNLLQSNLGQVIPYPDSYYEQWQLFTSIANSEAYNSDWRACLAYFSENWVNAIMNDPAWIKLKIYLFESFWARTKYERASHLYEMAFAMISNKKTIKLNPYLMESVKQLFTTALGFHLGFAPTTDENLMPLATINKGISDHYNYGPTPPTIMSPAKFDISCNNCKPVYYSMQCPTAMNMSLAARRKATVANELRQIHLIIREFREQILKDELFVDTIYHKMCKSVDFECFHNLDNLSDEISEIMTNETLFNKDKRFNPEQALSAKFMRGCIKISNPSTCLDLHQEQNTGNKELSVF